MKWDKVGLVFRPNVSLSWQYSHAALPTRLHLGGSVYRIFFSSRDVDNRTYVGWFETDLDRPGSVLQVASAPVLTPGPWGFFDDHGAQACSIVRADNGDLFMYYLGWNPGKKEPLFYTSIGLAVSSDGGETFHKFSDAPILQRSCHDPWMVSGGTVVRLGAQWIMYYLSGFRFDYTEDKPISWYDIKIARSEDGVEWARDGQVALGLQPNETNISRLTIDSQAGFHRAWFPVKQKGFGYRCGYAESVDAITWHRKDDLGLPTSADGWDSDAIDKMEVIRHKGAYYMFYNGNQFGRDGIGLAIGHV